MRTVRLFGHAASICSKENDDNEKIRSLVKDLLLYINGADAEDKKRKREEDKAAKKREGEVKAAARPPKRAKSAYDAFAADESVVSKLKTAHPDASSAELTKLKKKQWGELPEAERKAFTRTSGNRKLRFQ